MDTQQIHEAATRAHVVPGALDQVTARVVAHFGDGPVRPADLDQFLAALDVWVKLGMTYEAFDKMPPSWKADQGRRYEPPTVKRRPVTRSLTREELAGPELAGLTGAARTEKARQMQQTPLPEKQG